MSALLIHAQAARILGQVWADEFIAQTDSQLAAMAGMLAHGFSAAADQMIAESAAEAIAYSAAVRCTLDHHTLSGPKCPACGAPKS